MESVRLRCRALMPASPSVATQLHEIVEIEKTLVKLMRAIDEERAADPSASSNDALMRALINRYPSTR